MIMDDFMMPVPIQIFLQFMADIYLTCEVCNGKRFKQEVLEVVYKVKTISDVLDMTVDEAIRTRSSVTLQGQNNVS